MFEDQRLLNRLRAGDKDALRRIYEKYIGLGDIFSRSLFPMRCIQFMMLQVHEKHSNLLKRLAPGGHTDVPTIKPESDDI